MLNYRIMNYKSIIFAILIGICVGANAQELERVRSYYCQQISGPDTQYGPNQRVPDRQATYVEWYSDNTIKMMDGTIWQYRGRYNGFHNYAFVRASGMIMPGTQYVEAIFTADFSKMQVNYYFGIGMPGMAIPMNALYNYIGEGTQPAYDWMSGRY